MLGTHITGSGGFVGRKLAKRFDNITKIPHKEIDSLTLKPFDNFFFLSTYGNIFSQDVSAKIIKANLLDPVSAIHKASEFDFKSFVFVSTSSVKLKRQTMYSRAKKATEEIMLAYAEKYGLPICIVRPYSICGVGDNPKHLIPTILRSCFKGEQMNFVRDAIHDYVDVDDVVDAIMNLSEWGARGIFEVGTGIGTSNQEVLETIEDITGKKAKTNIVPKMRDYDNEEWTCKNYRARSFGWAPKKTLRQSLEEVVEDYKKHPNKYEN